MLHACRAVGSGGSSSMRRRPRRRRLRSAAWRSSGGALSACLQGRSSSLPLTAAAPATGLGSWRVTQLWTGSMAWMTAQGCRTGEPALCSGRMHTMSRQQMALHGDMMVTCAMLRQRGRSCCGRSRALAVRRGRSARVGELCAEVQGLAGMKCMLGPCQCVWSQTSPGAGADTWALACRCHSGGMLMTLTKGVRLQPWASETGMRKIC